MASKQFRLSEKKHYFQNTYYFLSHLSSLFIYKNGVNIKQYITAYSFVLGQPQMVKVVQNTNTQHIAQIKIKQNPVKVFKVSAASEGNNQVQKRKTIITSTFYVNA